MEATPTTPPTAEAVDAIEKIKPDDQEYELSTQAHEEFSNGEYDKCLDTLAKLSETSGSSTTLQHNRAVVQFYKSQCKQHVPLLQALNELHADEPSTSSSSSLIHCRNPTARYNKAVVYFHRHMHRTAIDTLMPLLEKFDSLDEGIKALVGHLMLRLLLATNQLNKALAFLDFLQNHLNIEADTSTEEGAMPIFTATVDDNFNRSLKLLTMLTQVLNHKVVAIPEDESVEFAALKAHQYYIMKDFQMAAKQFEKIKADSGTTSDELNTCIANNMGVIHLRVRHYAIAAKFFQNAINFDKHIAVDIRNTPLHQMSAVRSCEILYNLGIAMLYLRRPKEAFQCLLVPLKSYHSNPRLWFRMAEACIMEHEMKRLEDEKRRTTLAIVGGVRKEYQHRTALKYSVNSQSAAVPEPNLEFAALSLRNALTLTNFYRSSFDTSQPECTEGETSNWQTAKDNNFCNPSPPISKESLDTMLSAIYAAYSFVALRLGDYVQALEMAQTLLKMEKLSDAHKMLAHMYTGEALIMLDRLAEARPHLEPTFVSSLNAYDFETKDWEVKSLDAAQNIVRYNLAVAMALQGDIETAKNLLHTCTHPIVASKTISLHTYIELRLSK